MAAGGSAEAGVEEEGQAARKTLAAPQKRPPAGSPGQPESYKACGSSSTRTPGGAAAGGATGGPRPEPRPAATTAPGTPGPAPAGDRPATHQPPKTPRPVPGLVAGGGARHGSGNRPRGSRSAHSGHAARGGEHQRRRNGGAPGGNGEVPAGARGATAGRYELDRFVPQVAPALSTVGRGPPPVGVRGWWWGLSATGGGAPRQRHHTSPGSGGAQGRRPAPGRHQRRRLVHLSADSSASSTVAQSAKRRGLRARVTLQLGGEGGGRWAGPRRLGGRHMGPGPRWGAPGVVWTSGGPSRGRARARARSCGVGASVGFVWRFDHHRPLRPGRGVGGWAGPAPAGSTPRRPCRQTQRTRPGVRFLTGVAPGIDRAAVFSWRMRRRTTGGGCPTRARGNSHRPFTLSRMRPAASPCRRRGGSGAGLERGASIPASDVGRGASRGEATTKASGDEQSWSWANGPAWAPWRLGRRGAGAAVGWGAACSVRGVGRVRRRSGGRAPAGHCGLVSRMWDMTYPLVRNGVWSPSTPTTSTRGSRHPPSPRGGPTASTTSTAAARAPNAPTPHVGLRRVTLHDPTVRAVEVGVVHAALRRTGPGRAHLVSTVTLVVEAAAWSS